jgi:hypothetical protein
MSQNINVFIPFIEMNISKPFLKKVLEHQQFGHIVDVSIHEKKIKENNKLRSAKHQYAFISLRLFNTISSINLGKNVQNNAITHIVFNMDKIQGHWELKPYLTVSDRMERGFDLHIKNTSDHQDTSYVKWLGISLSIPNENDINLQKGEFAPHIKNVSFYDDINEKLECERDYYDIEACLNPYYTSSEIL